MDNFDARMAGQCALIGVVAGMRSMMAPAIVVNDIARRRPDIPMLRFLTLLHSPQSVKFTLFNATGELLFDKLPFAPSRTAAPSAIFRFCSGAVAGAALAASRSHSAWAGAAFGAAGALLGTYGGYQLRHWLDNHTPIPDPLIGIAEDFTALGLGKAATAG